MAERLNDFSLIHSLVENNPPICSSLPFQEGVVLIYVKIVELSLLSGVLLKSQFQYFDIKVKATDNNTNKYLTNFDEKKAPFSLQVHMYKF